MSKSIPPLAVSMMLQSLVSPMVPMTGWNTTAKSSPWLPDGHHRTKWGLPSIYWHQHLDIFNPSPLQQNCTLQWISIFFQQLWNTA